MFSPGSRLNGGSSPANGLSSSGKRRAGSPDTSPTGAMMVAPSSTSPRPSMVRSTLSSSMSDLVSMSSDSDMSMSNGQMTVVMQTQREWRNATAPLDQRWARAITIIPYCSMADQNGSGAAASEAVMQMQERVVSNELWMGLQDVKEWVSFNVHRILVPSEDPRERAISDCTPAAPFCVTMSGDSCGVRSYLQGVCTELRIDYFRVGGTYWEDGMMEDLLDAARQRRRALILFDRTNWFSNAEYGARGASFMHHLRAAMSSAQAQRAMMAAAGGPLSIISNSMQMDTMATLLPNLWIVISANNSDVVHEVIQMSSGAVYRLSNASEPMALSVVRTQLSKRGHAYGFSDADVSHTLSQTNYVMELQRIATVLQKSEVGAIVNIIAVACTIAYQRARLSPMYTTTLASLLPTAVDVQQAMNQLNGQSVGSVAGAVAATQVPSAAAEAARAINGGTARRH